MTTIRHSHHRFLPTAPPHSAITADSLELHESDLFFPSDYPNSSPPTMMKTASSRYKKNSKKTAASLSMPMNVPDWSKILKADNNRMRNEDEDEDADDDEDVDVVPPHELLARQMERTRVVCYSVHEGVGRTLKGRDLSRVRNAVWEKTGFQD